MSILAERIRSQFIRHGVQRSNRFAVTIPLPKELNAIISDTETDGLIPASVRKAINLGGILLGLNSNGDRSLQFVCRATDVPGFQMDTQSVTTNGIDFKVATGINREQIAFSFQLSEDAYEAQLLHNWRSLIINEETRKLGYYDDYVVDIQIDMLDINDKSVFTTYILDAWPTTVNSVQLNRLSTDMANTVETSWTFSRVSPTSRRDTAEGTGFSSGIPGSIGGILDGIANGDLESAAYAARQLVVQAQEGNFSGEAAAIFGKINEITRNTTGVSVTEMDKVGKQLEQMVNKASGIGSSDRTSLLNIVSKLSGGG